MDHPFRNAMFGGFNRQDVLTYLETTAKENAQQQQECQQKLEEAQEAAARQETELAALREQAGCLTEINDKLRTQQAQMEAELSASRAECDRTAQALDAARREVEKLKARVAALEPDASAYAAIKERTAGVELEAHRRAQAVLEESERQARQLRRQMEQWMQKVEREYDALRSEVESTVSHAADQLDKAGKSLEKVTALMGEQDVALEALAQAYADTDPAKVEAPLPLSENE